jgi:hypothetical protein
MKELYFFLFLGTAVGGVIYLFESIPNPTHSLLAVMVIELSLIFLCLMQIKFLKDEQRRK